MAEKKPQITEAAGKKLEKSCINSKIFKFLVLFIFLFSLVARFYWGLEKQGFHVDEILSITMANRNSLNAISVTENKTYSKENLLRNLFFNDSSAKDCFNDISKLYHRTKDAPHTNFYYSLLRLSFLGRLAQNLKNIIHTGVALNCLFFSISFFFFYKLLLLLYKDRFLILTTLFCSSVASSAISNTMFLRPYQLQSTMLIMLTFVILKILVEKKFTRKMFAMLSLSTALGLLSGYFSIIYIGLFGLFILIYYSFQKEFKKILFYGSSFFIGAALTPLLYPKYWKVIFAGSDRAGEAYQKINFQYFINNIYGSAQTIYKFISDYAIYGLSIFLLIIILNALFIFIKKQKMEINYLALGVLMICFLFSVIAILLAPIKEIRYIAPVLPLLSLVIPLGISTFKNKLIKNGVLIAFIAISAINCFDVEKINYLYENKVEEINFLEGSDSTICILVTPKNGWRFLEWIPYAKDKQSYLFFSDKDAFRDYVEKSSSASSCVYAIIDTLYSENEFENIRSQITKKFTVSGSLLTVKDGKQGFEMFKLQLSK